MTRWSRWAARALICLSFPALAQTSTVVTFDDISPNDLADGYGGLTGWAGLGGVGISDHDLGGHGYKAFFGQRGLLSFLDGPVRFEGTLYKSYAAPQDEPPFAALELWYQGARMASITDPRTPLAMVWLTSSYQGPLDAIRFEGGVEGFSIDDLSFVRLPVSSVPEPTPGMLLAVGLAALAWQSGRRAGARRHGR